MLALQNEEIEVSSILPKANTLNRFIAKFLDFLIVSAIGQIPLASSFLAALSFLLLSDGLSGGRSPGKQIIGLQVISQEKAQRPSFKESILRNFSMGLAYLSLQIPYIGWILAVSILVFESLLIIGNPKGLRVGDELAKTQILDYTFFETMENQQERT